jgi:multicomponent Na+:H+ antiporter subunit A
MSIPVATRAVMDLSFQLLVGAALPFLAAAVIVAFSRLLGKASGWVVLAASISSFALLAGLAGPVEATPVSFRAAWLPSLGVDFHLRADPFGLFFACLVSGIGVLVTVYSLSYLRDESPALLRRYYAALAAFMGAMIGIALADDLIVLFVFWEITSLSSFILIGYRFENAEARTGAVRALLVTALGGLVMSVGFLLVGSVAGTFSLNAISSDPARVQALLASPLCSAALLCILAGAFTKSAQFPFHFWLPKAMVAPTPISAYLHAATMVKAGIFLLARMEPLFGASPLWAPVLVTVGTTSLLLGAWQTCRESDLKAILARSTGASLGGFVLMYGLGAAGQDALQILSHALYKGSLFLLVGIVEHRMHTRDLDRLGGLARTMPVACATFCIAALSMAGVPPLLGFVAKEGLFVAILESEALSPAARAPVAIAAVAAGAFLIAAAWRMTTGIFFGQRREHDGHAHDAQHHAATGGGELALLGPPLLLASGALAAGVLAAFPGTIDWLFEFSSQPQHLHLSSIPHPGTALTFSIAAFALGAAIIVARDRLSSLADRLRGLPPAENTWDASVAGIMQVGSIYSSRWENGSMRWYLGATLAALPLLVAIAFDSTGLSYRRIEVSLQDLPWYGLVCCTMLGVATVAAVAARTRLAAAITTTMVGFLVAMMFVIYRSPDILLTQLLIETVSTIFLLLVLVHLPPFRLPDLSASAKLVNGAVAAAVGLCVTVMLLLAMSPGLRETDNIATRPGGLLARSLADGGGQNSVNVIIVDLRALDTTGEVTVLVVVGLCIYGLLRTRRRTA